MVFSKQTAECNGNLKFHDGSASEWSLADPVLPVLNKRIKFRQIQIQIGIDHNL